MGRTMALVGPFREFPGAVSELLGVLDTGQPTEGYLERATIPDDWGCLREYCRATETDPVREGLHLRRALGRTAYRCDRVCLLLNVLVEGRAGLLQQPEANTRREILSFFGSLRESSIDCPCRLWLSLFSAIELYGHLLSSRGYHREHRVLIRLLHGVVFRREWNGEERPEAISRYFCTLRLAVPAIRRNPAAWRFLAPRATVEFAPFLRRWAAQNGAVLAPTFHPLRDALAMV